MKRLVTLGNGGGWNIRSLDLRHGLPAALPPDLPNITNPGSSATAPFARYTLSPDNVSAVFISGASSANNYRYIPDVRIPLSGRPPAEVYDTPGIVFSGVTRSCGISNDYYAVGGEGGLLYVFARVDNTFTSVTTSGLGNIDSIKFSPNGQYMAVLHRTSPYIRIYNTSDWSFVNGSAAASNEGSAANNYERMAFTADSSKIVVCGDANPHHTVFDAVTGTRLVATNSTAWSGNCIVAHPTDPNILYRASGLSTSISAIAKVNIGTNTQEATAAPGGAVDNHYAMVIDPEDMILYYSRSSSLSMPFGDSNWTTFVFALDLIKDEMVVEPSLTQMFNSNPESMAIVNLDRHKITGTVRDVNNDPAERVVRAYRRSDGALMAQTLSNDTTGDYELRVPDAGPYDVQFMTDTGELLNDLFFARSEPEPI